MGTIDTILCLTLRPQLLLGPCAANFYELVQIKTGLGGIFSVMSYNSYGFQALQIWWKVLWQYSS